MLLNYDQQPRGSSSRYNSGFSNRNNRNRLEGSLPNHYSSPQRQDRGHPTAEGPEQQGSAMPYLDGTHRFTQNSSSPYRQDQYTRATQGPTQQGTAMPHLDKTGPAACQRIYKTLSANERKVQDIWVHEQIRIGGGCPHGYAWYRDLWNRGYACRGGSHNINDEDLAEFAGNPDMFRLIRQRRIQGALARRTEQRESRIRV